MKGLRTSLTVLLVVFGLIVAARLTVRAQERPATEPKPREGHDVPRQPPPQEREDRPILPSPTVQEALLRPLSLPFGEPTSLAEVVEFLTKTLKAPVVLDRAALDRLEITPDDTVQLQLDGVRLKVGLKLLLDQVGLTFQNIPEDNLLVLTDTQGSADPMDQVLHEMKAVHRDLHDLQDAVDDIRWSLGIDDEESGATMRKPTIIEEVPQGDDKPGEKSHRPPVGPADRPRTRPGI
jgi:hypothetical protein